MTCSASSRRSSAKATCMRPTSATAAASRAARAAAWEATESVVAPGLPTLPYLAPWYRITDVEGGLALEHGHSVVRLDGAATRRLLPALLPLLDGTRTVDQVVTCVGEPARPAVER